MKILWLDKNIKYTGEQLSSLWLEHNVPAKGDSIIAFSGPADVNEEYLVDLEDIAKKEFIYSEDMLHFIVEISERNLGRAIALQRLLIVQIKEQIEKMAGLKLLRFGDDLYENKAKLTVSIATLSPASSLIHVGLNISSKNTPLLTKGLADYRIEPKNFAQQILKIFQEEYVSMDKASRKVREVK
ncbi:DUF366 family protein [Candidatus Margulisiibacteriota bacterium]